MASCLPTRRVPRPAATPMAEAVVVLLQEVAPERCPPADAAVAVERPNQCLPVVGIQALRRSPHLPAGDAKAVHLPQATTETALVRWEH